MVMDFPLSHKSTIELMQNCDLPPPVKIFAGPNKAISFPNSEKYCKHQVVERINKVGEDLEKLELLNALRLSQTRAREAETKAAVMSEEKDRLMKAFMYDASRLFAYRQWVSLFELELLMLQKLKQERIVCNICEARKGIRWLSNDEGDDGNGSDFTWFIALAFCFGIAGVGFAFGSRCLV